MGFPDDWVTYPITDLKTLGPGWGKGVSVHAGRWIAHWARESLLGNPGQYDQKNVTDLLAREGDDLDEKVIDVTKHWKTVAV
mgnify:FL=1